MKRRKKIKCMPKTTSKNKGSKHFLVLRTNLLKKVNAYLGFKKLRNCPAKGLASLRKGWIPSGWDGLD